MPHLLGWRLASTGWSALLFLDLSRQEMQVEKSLLDGSAEASLRKHESRRLWTHAEQYLESITNFNSRDARCRRETNVYQNVLGCQVVHVR